MKKTEILESIMVPAGFDINSFKSGGIGEMITILILKAMDEWGLQVFEAGKEAGYESYFPKLERIKPMNYDDYLKEQENEKN